MSGDAPAPLSPAAQRRLDEHLELLRARDDEPAPAALVRRVVRRARAQQLMRVPLLIVATIAAGAIDGIAGLLGVRRAGRKARPR